MAARRPEASVLADVADRDVDLAAREVDQCGRRRRRRPRRRVLLRAKARESRNEPERRERDRGRHREPGPRRRAHRLGRARDLLQRSVIARWNASPARGKQERPVASLEQRRRRAPPRAPTWRDKRRLGQEELVGGTRERQAPPAASKPRRKSSDGRRRNVLCMDGAVCMDVMPIRSFVPAADPTLDFSHGRRRASPPGGRSARPTTLAMNGARGTNDDDQNPYPSIALACARASSTSTTARGSTIRVGRGQGLAHPVRRPRDHVLDAGDSWADRAQRPHGAPGAGTRRSSSVDGPGASTSSCRWRRDARRPAVVGRLARKASRTMWSQTPLRHSPYLYRDRAMPLVTLTSRRRPSRPREARDARCRPPRAGRVRRSSRRPLPAGDRARARGHRRRPALPRPRPRRAAATR